MPKMVVVNGVRYTEDDARRRGLKADETVESPAGKTEVIRATPVDDSDTTTDAKARTGSRNKARTAPDENK